MGFSERLALIQTKIAHLAEIDTNFEVFGSSRHHYQFNPPLLLNKLKLIEARLGIYFPEDYRQFLVTLGNGGAGPNYGIHSIEYSLKEDGGDPRLPCVLFPNMSADQFKSTIIEDDAPDFPANGYFFENFEPYNGLWLISDPGCVGEVFMVLNGEHKGRVFSLNYDNPPPSFAPQLSFLEWYEAWLSHSIEWITKRKYKCISSST